MRGQLGQVTLFWLIGLVIIAGSIAAAFTGIGVIVTVIGVPIGLGFLVAPVLLTRTIRYRITTHRIDFERGLFNKAIDTLELWHVDDISFRQSLVDRVLGVGTITIVSGDRTTPQLTLQGLPDPRPLFENLKQRVIAVKRQRGVIKMDIG